MAAVSIQSAHPAVFSSGVCLVLPATSGCPVLLGTYKGHAVLSLLEAWTSPPMFFDLRILLLGIYPSPESDKHKKMYM